MCQENADAVALLLYGYSKVWVTGQSHLPKTVTSGQFMMIAPARSSTGDPMEPTTNPRLSRLTRSEVSGDSLGIYDRVLRDRGNVPNMFRTMAHRPQIFETIIDHMDAVLKTGTISTALKELVIVRTSQLNRTPYCLASHSALARRLGWTDDQLVALENAQTSDLFSESEKVAIHLAEVMTLNAHGYSDEDFTRLRSFYSEGEVVELMAAIGLFNYFNRFNDLLQMEPTKPANAEELAQVAAAPV
jgi:uncharacterized peroxidase-related enzyme